MKTVRGVEEKVIGFIEKYVVQIYLSIIFAFALFIRRYMFDGQSGDMNDFLLPWFEKLRQDGGIYALGQAVSDYNVPYVTILALLTYLPFNPVYMIKAVSIIFDFLLAGAALLLVHDSGVKEQTLVFVALLFSPVVILNSSYWGQCDSIYVTFLILALAFLRKEKWLWAFVIYGIAFSFKLQAVFMLPFLVVLYLRTRKFSIVNFLLIPITNFIMCLPAIVMGRPILDVLSIYFSQTSTYQSMSMNYPNLYYIYPLPYELFHRAAIIFAMTVLGTGALWVIKEKIEFDLHNMVYFVIWSIWSCCMFLPAMHERYGYCMELLLIIYAIIWKKKIFTAIIVNLITVCAYSGYLFGVCAFGMNVLAVVNLTLYLMFTIDGLKGMGKSKEQQYGRYFSVLM